MLIYSIQKSDMDLRKMLYQNIVLSGGSTLFKGFGDRLLSEIKKHVAKDMKIRVSGREWTLPVGMMTYPWLMTISDSSTARAPVLDLDGWFDPGLLGHVQEDVDLEAGVRRGGPEGDP